MESPLGVHTAEIDLTAASRTTYMRAVTSLAPSSAVPVRPVAAAVAFCVALLLATGAAHAELELISAKREEPTHGGNDRSDVSNMSANGRFVAFQSLATDLLPKGVDGNGLYDVFVRDRMTGNLELISVVSAGAVASNRASTNALLSPDGRFAIFESTGSDLVPGFVDGNNPALPDVYLRDRTSGTTTLVSVNASGTASANAPSDTRQVTDGGIVLFTSGATDLTPDFVDGNSSSGRDVFVRAPGSGTTTLVSVNASGTASGNKDSAQSPSISADGRLVAFASDASDLVAGGLDSNGRTDVFVRDLVSGTTSLISINSSGTASGNSASGASVGGSVVMTADGRYVAFVSLATDLVEGLVDTNGASDLFVRDLSTGTTTLISASSSGAQTGNGAVGNGAFEGFAMSVDGRFLAFSSRATDLVDGQQDENGQMDVFVRDRLTGTTALVSAAQGSTTATGNYRSNMTSVRSQSISSDGRFVFFFSGATDLVPDFVRQNGLFGYDLFLRDTTAGSTALVSAAADGVSGANQSISTVATSADGRVAAFSTTASNLLPSGQIVASDVYAFRNQAPSVMPSPSATPSTPQATTTATPTATVAPTSSPTTNLPQVTPSATTEVAQATPTSTPPGPPPLVGDCSRDGRVTVDELIISVDIALGNVAVDACPVADPNNDRRVGIDELVRAVDAALDGALALSPQP